MNVKDLLKEFLSEPNEAHALWYGFFFSFSKISRASIATTNRVPKETVELIKSEWHYYTLGFFIGRMVQACCLFYLGYKGLPFFHAESLAL